jgi:hypothetical protein
MLLKVTILPSVRHPVRSVLPRLTLVFRMAAWPTSLVRYVLTIVRRACAPGIGGGGTCSTASDRIETHFGTGLTWRLQEPVNARLPSRSFQTRKRQFHRCRKNKIRTLSIHIALSRSRRQPWCPHCHHLSALHGRGKRHLKAGSADAMSRRG